MNNFSIVVLSIFLSVNLFASSSMDIKIIPTPQRVEFSNGVFSLFDNITISISDVKLKFIAQEISKSLNDFHQISAEVSNNKGDINLQIVDALENIDVTGTLYQQAYNLIVSENKISILSTTPEGLFYGAMSLVQLIEHSATKEIPAMTISDWPNMEFRGISDDISRGQVSTIKNFKRIIDFLARYKMNIYMPYLEDMLEFDSYPSIGVGRGRLSKKEVREIVKYANQRYIDVIPAFQTLGHYENILNMNEFVDYAEFPGAASLSVTEKKTYTFLEKLLKEVFELFPSKYINIGADESYDVGYGKSKELTKKIGKSKIHAEHYKKVFEICKKNNKQIMMYGDVILNHKDILELIPNDVMIIDWHYGASSSYPSTDIFKDAGFEFIVSPSVWNFRTTFPTYQVALPNIKTIIGDGLLNGSRGMINSNWGDYGAETFKEFVLFGYAWSAQCSWNYNESKLSDFNNLFFADFFGVDDYKLSSLYQTFSTQQNQMQWHEVWRHPVLELPKAAWWASRINREEVSSWMNWTLPEAFKNIDEFEGIVTKNKDHLDLLRFIINLDYWYQDKLKLNFYLTSIIELDSLKEKLLKSSREKEKLESQIKSIERRLAATNVTELIENNLSQLDRIKLQYNSLWLEYYKSDNLNMIIDKFNRLVDYLNETKEKIAKGTLESPVIESKWIYASKRKQRAYKKAEFKREFTIKNKVKSAKLQLIADTHAKLYINGKFVDEIFSKRSLSLVTEYDRILYLDATKYLKKGKNTISLRVENYRSSKGAGINFISQIKTTKGVFEIISDKKWKSRSLNPKSKWKKSITKDYKYIVIAPNFATDRTSWIER